MPAKSKSPTAKKGIGERLTSAVAHPLRMEVLRILSYRTASPNELSRELREPLGKVSYHVKVLKDFECIELVRTEPRRGAVEHYYRAVMPAQLNSGEWGKLAKSKREEISSLVLQGIFGEAVRAMEKGTFDARKNRQLMWVPVELDEKGWMKLVARQDEWLEEVYEARAESSERLMAAGERGQRAVVAIMCFETPPGFGFAGAEQSGSRGGTLQRPSE